MHGFLLTPFLYEHVRAKPSASVEAFS